MTKPTLDPAILNQWLGKTQKTKARIDASPAKLMQATLGETQNTKEGEELPALWHWLYFLEAKPPAELGRDGHPKLGGFLPPVALPRRMWAGGRFDFIKPLVIGSNAVKTSKIEAIHPKNGRSGSLCFVTVSHSISVNGVTHLREEHDIVYREDPKPSSPKPPVIMPPSGREIRKTITFDPITLYRYSALTFNGHRIHYDPQYCRTVEGYPSLIVHGPLIGTILADLATKTKSEKTLKSYWFKAHSPVFVSTPVSFNVKTMGSSLLELWAENPDGGVAVSAGATFV